nr:MAG TPA: RlmM ferredoxin-like domain [Bacteriophage sp.]
MLYCRKGFFNGFLFIFGFDFNPKLINNPWVF